MRHRGAWYSRYARPWEDRVAGTDETFGPADIDVDKVVDDALAAARTTIECTILPLVQMLEGLPRTIDIEWGSRGKRTRRHRHDRAWDW